MLIHHLFIVHLYKYSILHIYINNTLSIPEAITMTLNVGVTLVLEAIILALNVEMLFVIVTHCLCLPSALVRASFKKKHKKTLPFYKESFLTPIPENDCFSNTLYPSSKTKTSDSPAASHQIKPSALGPHTSGREEGRRRKEK